MLSVVEKRIGVMVCAEDASDGVPSWRSAPRALGALRVGTACTNRASIDAKLLQQPVNGYSIFLVLT